MVNFDRRQVTAYLCISVLYSLIGVPANIVSLTFFLWKDDSEHISRLLFILLNSTDLFVCLCFSLLSISYISILNEGNIYSTSYCSIVLATFPTAQQFSVFVTAVLCLLRTISIVKPILTISKRLVFTILSAYFVILIVRNILLFLDDSVQATFSFEEIKCGWMVVETGRLADFYKFSLVLICLILIPSILGCLISICCLKRRSQQFPVSATKRKATVTVVILTTICVAASSAFVVERIMRMRGMKVSALMENIALQFAYSFTCVANPAVYFIRLSRLRVFVMDSFTSFRVIVRQLGR